MRVDADVQSLPVGRVIATWAEGGLRLNPEYQRGSVWTKRQQQLLVDSVLRGYPLPRFYFYAERAHDLLGASAATYLIVDGLQRIKALADFAASHWPLLDPVDETGLFPRGIREGPCPWAHKSFADLSSELREKFLQTPLPVVLIESFDSEDEVRDLFIRLQAGTALTRQQVRDAWPGNIGPFIEGLAGKLSHVPRYDFLARLDRRGSRRDDDEEITDRYHDARQTAAQLLRLFLEWRKDGSITGLRSPSLDDLYHSETDFDVHGEAAVTFERVLGYCQAIVVSGAPPTSGKKPASVTKRALFGLFIELAKLDRRSDVPLSRNIDKVGKAFWNTYWYNQKGPSSQGRTTEAGTIQAVCDWMEQHVLAGAGLPILDPHRLFSEDQQRELLARADGTCDLCGQSLSGEEVEFDHIKPWIDGGETDVANGRAVHARCNRRRRTSAASDVTARMPASAP